MITVPVPAVNVPLVQVQPPAPVAAIFVPAVRVLLPSPRVPPAIVTVNPTFRLAPRLNVPLFTLRLPLTVRFGRPSVTVFTVAAMVGLFRVAVDCRVSAPSAD